MKNTILFLFFITSLYSQTLIRVPQDYDKIQTAIDSSNISDTILVSPGTYRENLKITKPVTLIGGTTGSTVITTDSLYLAAIYINASNVLLSNIHIKKIPANEGIMIENSDSCIIDNCVIDSNLSIVSFTEENDYHGIDVKSSKNIIISNSVVKDNKGGTYISFGTAEGCDGIGLVLDSSSNVEIKNCLFVNNKRGELNVTSYGKGVGIKLNKSNKNIFIRNCSIYKNNEGILFSYNSNAVVGGSISYSNNIYNNSSYNIFNSTLSTINATYNNWKTDDIDSIKSKFFGKVDFSNFITNVFSLKSGIPKNFILLQNYPNPFNPGTHIVYSLPASGKAEINIYDSLGRLVDNLFDGYQTLGKHELLFDGRNLSSGIYYYVLKYRGQKIVNKMILLK